MNEKERTHIDLFTGIGGFALAARRCGVKTIAFCEKDKFCQKVIRKNFGTEAPIVDDIHAFDGRRYRGAWLLTGGFPCQPFSVAGKRRGAEDDRFLWPEMLRVADEVRPTFIIGENVAGFVTMELDRCISDLAGIGYASRPIIVPACAVDAKHRRDRVWILGYAEHAGQPAAEIGRSGVEFLADAQRNVVRSRLCEAEANRYGNQSSDGRPSSNDAGKRQQGFRQTGGQSANQNGEEKLSVRNCGRPAIWSPEPNVGRVADGVPNRVDRLRGLGNAIVPQVVEVIISAMIQVDEQR